MPIVILLDTNAIIFHALLPTRLSRKARRLIAEASTGNYLACCDISLWEIAMLTAKGRLDPGTSALEFIKLTLTAGNIQVIPVNPDIAALSVSFPDTISLDPADRLIAATAIHYRATLITTDRNLLQSGLLTVLK